MSNTNPLKPEVNPGASEGFAVPAPIVTHFLLLFLLKPGDKTSMGKGREWYYDKRNISLVICDTDIAQRSTKSW